MRSVTRGSEGWAGVAEGTGSVYPSVRKDQREFATAPSPRPPLQPRPPSPPLPSPGAASRAYQSRPAERIPRYHSADSEFTALTCRATVSCKRGNRFLCKPLDRSSHFPSEKPEENSAFEGETSSRSDRQRRTLSAQTGQANRLTAGGFPNGLSHAPLHVLCRSASVTEGGEERRYLQGSAAETQPFSNGVVDFAEAPAIRLSERNDD
ncbi:hypothetical protein SKAU_G00290340 [Synaphobranchus kaupii]|uniref:Uncharacterized protein n=1 Tax=Synaphobranchus kaupii TaxID=118154 RepID=A0A9Q1ETK8_SYNKA|nr:hypothetical protein SKAU_G00290340 [Synaphobranchus kaupii]